MIRPSTSVPNTKAHINYTIQAMEATPYKYRKIFECAHDDGHIDKEEKELLSQFQQMLRNGSIKRVKS